ncbi:MAG: transcriptional regulator [Anaerotignum sp.]
MDGWIKLYRKIVESPVFDNPELLKIWLWMLIKASHSEHEQLIGLQTVNLAEGQFVFGRNAASIELGMHPSKIYRLIKTLEKSGKIKVKSNNKFSVITVVNWGLYQGSGDAEWTTNEQRANSSRTPNEQQMNTNKNEKNEKNGKNERKNSVFAPPSFAEVKAYCDARGNGIDAQQFVDFYTAKGWMIGRNKMSDWKAAVRTWEKKNGVNTSGKNSRNTSNEWAGFNGIEL